MFELAHLTRRYGGFTAVDDLNLVIGRGEVVGLLGHNGAGKTTVMKMLTGYLEPTAGTIRVGDLEIGRDTRAIQSRIGYLPENCPVWPDMTVIDFLEYQAALHDVPQARRAQAVIQAIRRTALKEKAAASIHTLSRGYRQRLGVASTFLADRAPDKRAKRIDALLASPGYVDYWTLKWGDLLLANRKDLQERGVWAFRNWIRESVATNKPYDEFVRELLTASGNSLEHPAANYYRIGREPEAVMENMTQVFLGTRFNCNKCHDHPFERWTQKQYYELAGYFSGVGFAPAGRPEAELVYALEERFEIEVDGDEVTGEVFETLGSLATFVEAQLP